MTKLPRVCRNCMKLTNRPNAKYCNQCRTLIPGEVEIFFSYAHADEALRNNLAKHLVALQHMRRAILWYDGDIKAGEEWAHAITTHLRTAEIILLLVSPDFLASDYCYSVEMQEAVNRHILNQARIIPIILRPCHWKTAPFGVLQALPTNAKPVTAWDNEDDALLDIVEGIHRAIDDSY